MRFEKPREIAALVLDPAGGQSGFVEERLLTAFNESPLKPADRGLCQELVYGVIRWQATLDWLVARKTDGRLQKPALQNLLRLGLFQLFWLDRVPEHAAVHETVEQTKQLGLTNQARFVNAILRAYVRERAETERLLAELKSTQPHLGWSQPEWLVQRWTARWGAEKAARLLEWNNTPPKTYARLNTLRTDATCLIERWRAEDVEYDFFQRDWTGESLIFELKSHPHLPSLGSFRDGWFYIQDPSTLLAVQVLAPRPGETILDTCAAPGGKTTFIAQQMNNTGRIVAHDESPTRLKLVEENCARLGVTCVEPTPQLGPSALHFDRVLIDAPCSNTGVLRRRVDLRWRVRLEEIGRLAATQLDLLDHAATLLKPGATLVYSTCSLEPEENRDVIAAFLHAHPAFELEHERELFPFADGTDGAYVARLSQP